MYRTEARQGVCQGLGEAAALLERQASHAAASCSHAAQPSGAPQFARLQRFQTRNTAPSAAQSRAYASVTAGLSSRAAHTLLGLGHGARSSATGLPGLWLRPRRVPACAGREAAMTVLAARAVHRGFRARGLAAVRQPAACWGATAAAAAARGARRGFSAYGCSTPELPQWVRARMANIPALPEGAGPACCVCRQHTYISHPPLVLGKGFVC